MSKLDKQKETLTTLRVFFSVFMAIIVAISGSLVTMIKENSFDITFYFGFLVVVVFSGAVVGIVIQLKRKTDEIERM